jgi:DNA-binding MarR family transcriptional regulator
MHHAKATLVLRRFRVVFNAVRTHFQQVEAVAGVGGAQVWALSVIRANPGLGVTDLAAAMDVHQSTASNLVKSMISRGLISTSKGIQDKRSVALTILPAGEQVLKQAPGPFEGVLPDALMRLEPEQLDRLDLELAALIKLLQADETAEKKPLAHL